MLCAHPYRYPKQKKAAQKMSGFFFELKKGDERY
jgi:hypothetical protein